ncbi:hypothetical protein U1Q18_004345 [Sarracenia purpurea var. burkii]
MDTKAVAKSKRAHSYHQSKKYHPNLRAKARLMGLVGTSSANKPSGKQVREKPHDPSNNNSQVTDSVVLKSKWADYGHLISKAKSQSQTNITMESFPSFDDVLAED